MKIIASKSVIEGKPILAMCKVKEDWLVVSTKDNNEEFDFEPDDFNLIDEEYLYQRIPLLNGNLSQPNGTIINIDYETGEINFNKKHFHFGFPTHGARATRQANTEFSYLRWLKTYYSTYKKLALVVILFGGLGYFVNKWFLLPLLPIILIKYLLDSKERDMYLSGALLPAIVIDANQDLIAVLTDLTLGIGKYPIIKIQKLKIPKEKRVANTKLAVAGQYYNTKKYKHWNFFRPLILYSGMKNPDLHDEKIKQIPTAEWVELTSKIKNFNGEFKAGYYPINVSTSNWKDIVIGDIKWVN